VEERMGVPSPDRAPAESNSLQVLQDEERRLVLGFLLRSRRVLLVGRELEPQLRHLPTGLASQQPP
jgi:hypothetical protein